MLPCRMASERLSSLFRAFEQKKRDRLHLRAMSLAGTGSKMPAHQSGSPQLEVHGPSAALQRCSHSIPVHKRQRLGPRSRVQAVSSTIEVAEAPRPSWQTLPIRHVLESQQFDKVVSHECDSCTRSALLYDLCKD